MTASPGIPHPDTEATIVPRRHQDALTASDPDTAGSLAKDAGRCGVAVGTQSLVPAIPLELLRCSPARLCPHAPVPAVRITC